MPYAAGRPGPEKRATTIRPAARRTRGRPVAAAASLLVTAGTLVACGGDSGGASSLTWYINPDAGGQAEIAARCTEASEGRYTIETALLPRDAASQREQLIRRLAANDDSIDLMSLDPPFIPEFAQAGFLAPVPEDVAQRVTEDVVESAVEGSTWDDELVAIPFWANTQVLWYRKSVAEAAGLDMEEPVTWEQIVQAAEETGTLVGAQGARAESLTVWFNALIESAGGSIITDASPEDPAQIELGLDTEAGQRATEVMKMVAESEAAGAAFSTSNEDSSATGLESENGGFNVNYPFVYPRALGAVEAGTMDASVPEDYAAAIYPRVDEDEPAAPPYGGINLGVGAFSESPELAYEAAECIVSDENQAYYFVTNGNPASATSVYDDPEVLEAFPMAPVIRESLELAAPRPQTPYYNEISVGIQRSYHPPSGVDPGRTGERATELIKAVLAKEDLL
ncbi:extracellular solute-binding protein [Blastococcus saxobsidens]|uniref:Carbohydrate ABC transporter substrate-binding protein (CUT1 family) n=1 Tax=Blastococcus saxobsidens TaxID=138336 RepID=A0A4Q7Y460_9ACTN|nr:extracellular solute-binding protein [Blastococcus saxobsidens]RZU31378.1 carbohydrate ABC transporter substrate-binding protein (CUT1 family) [Blastococcus saxobsidens]